MIKKYRNIVFRISVMALVIAGVGYISSVITQRRCEDSAARMLAIGPMQGKPFYVMVGDAASYDVFTRVGAKFTQYVMIRDPKKRFKRITRLTWPDMQPVPSVDKGGRIATVSRARITLPFLVSVEYSSVEASLSGGGGTLYYFCLFGWPFKVIDAVSWVS